MHPNRAFRENKKTRDIEAAKERAFGCLTVAQDGAPLASHIPFIMPKDDLLIGHVVRNSPMAKALAAAAPAMMIVSLGDSYISPDWYGVEDQVPTWNYVAIHISGMAQLVDHAKLPDTLAAQSAELEAHLLPKKPWHADKMTDGVYERMQRAIVPFEMKIEDIQSTWKLNQNKTPEAIEGAASALRDAGFGLNTEWISDQMLNALADKDQS